MTKPKAKVAHVVVEYWNSGGFLAGFNLVAAYSTLPKATQARDELKRSAREPERFYAIDTLEMDPA